MAVDFIQIGQRLKAHRVGLGITPEEAADRLGVSRAALYNYERGSAPIKVETLERMADLLGVSLPSLLGVGTEYFATAIGYFERLRQLEEVSQRLVLYYEPINIFLTSEAYADILRTMLKEGLPADLPDRRAAAADVDRLLAILLERRAALGPGGPAIASIIGTTEVKRLAHTGLIGAYNLSQRQRVERREAARAEIEHVAALMEKEPLGVQIGVVDDTLPNQNFEICRLRDGAALVAVSPFRLGEFPNVRLGVASITASNDAVELYERLATQMWERSAKGAAGAALLRKALAEF